MVVPIATKAAQLTGRAASPLAASIASCAARNALTGFACSSQLAVKGAKQPRGRAVVNVPLTCDDKGHADPEKRPCDTDRPFASGDRADRRAARGQDYELSAWQAEPRNVASEQRFGCPRV